MRGHSPAFRQERTMTKRSTTRTRLFALALAAAGLAGAGTSVWAQDDDYYERHGDRYGRADSEDSDPAIDDRVHFSLERALGDRADDISVRVVDGVVYLTGLVPTESERRIAHDAVYDVDGVRGLRIGNLYARSYYNAYDNDRY
jgi:hypothetical protein